jgi:aspartate-semialdehyde dehydrogenase
MSNFRIAIVGASGNVGRRLIAQLLTQPWAKEAELTLLASPKSAGQLLMIDGKTFTLQALSEEALQHQDLVLFCTETDVSSQWVPVALKTGAYVIDSSSHYRLDKDVPLIIPPVNIHKVTQNQKLYAHANCLASPISTVIAPLHKALGVKYLNVATYQSTSGAGKAAMDECFSQTEAVVTNKTFQPSVFKRQIAFNVIPQVGSIAADGSTSEEYKIIHEVQKVVEAKFPISAMAVRVPVMIGHSIAMTVSFDKAPTIAAVQDILTFAKSVTVSKNDYETPAEVVGQDNVFVGRMRLDTALPNGLQLWLCSDNLRRGAATDAIEIATAIASF